MSRPDLNELLAFLAVAREGSFTRAAATLGVSQSALSQTVRKLEERLGVRLLSRTTRSVSTTPAGERLANTVGPHFDGIETEVDALTALQDKPAGTVRITCGEAPLRNLLLPRLAPLVRDYPDIVLEFDVNYGLRDIVAERFDAGVRLGSMIDKDMIAARLGPAGPHGRGGLDRLPGPLGPASASSRIDGTPLHQPAHGVLQRPLRLGLREAWRKGQGARRWPADLQHLAAAD